MFQKKGLTYVDFIYNTTLKAKRNVFAIQSEMVKRTMSGVFDTVDVSGISHWKYFFKTLSEMKQRLEESDFHIFHMTFCHFAPKMMNRMRQGKNSRCSVAAFSAAMAAAKLSLSRNQHKVVVSLQKYKSPWNLVLLLQVYLFFQSSICVVLSFFSCSTGSIN